MTRQTQIPSFFFTILAIFNIKKKEESIDAKPMKRMRLEAGLLENAIEECADTLSREERNPLSLNLDLTLRDRAIDLPIISL